MTARTYETGTNAEAGYTSANASDNLTTHIETNRILRRIYIATACNTAVVIVIGAMIYSAL